MIDEKTGGIVILKTKRELEDEEEDRFDSELRAEALAMLDRARQMIEQNGVEGIAIAIVFEDGGYGRLMPSMVRNVAGLIGATETLKHDMVLRTLTEDTE